MLERLTAWADAHIATAPELAYIGFAASSAALLYVGAVMAGGVFRLVRRGASSATLGAAAREAGPGFRILIAESGAARPARFIERALGAHLDRFAFGAPYSLLRAGQLPAGSRETALAAARRRLARSGADMIVWPELNGRMEDGLSLHGLSRGGGASAETAEPFTLFTSGRRENWTGDLEKAIAYRLAKKLQPALAHPDGFRPEKMKDIAAELDALLRAENGVSGKVRTEFEDDFCAAALHAAEAGEDHEFVDAVIELRRARLSAGSGRSADLVQTRLDLGRALLLRAEKAFDPIVVREGMEHLDAVIASLRNDHSIRRARLASDAVTKGKSLLETRKRFSLNFAG